MIIDFENMETQVMNNFKDGEKYTEAKMFVDDNNRIMFGRLIPGASIGLHKHKGSSEIIFVQDGFDADNGIQDVGACVSLKGGKSVNV